MFTNILCPVDFSADSERALAAALALARATHGHVTLVTVVDPLLEAGASAAGADAALDAQTQQELRQLLDRAAPGLPPATVAAVSVRVGEPAKEILAQADDCNADIIVMGMRGLGRPQKLLLGSTSHDVLERAAVPVLVVPPPDRR
ncbi:MAG TPA: universal stress protein [Vicinamibacterales bacterium]|nr:universal stress protein [Vicinamibacterales bacterium]